MTFVHSGWGAQQDSFAIYDAVMKQDAATVERLLKHGANPNGNVDKFLVAPLKVAAMNGHVGILTALIEAGADLNLQDLTGATALHGAAQEGHESVATLLIKEGAAIDLPDLIHSATPLHVAIQNGHLNVVKVLINHGANITAKTSTGDTPMQLANINNKTDIERYLADRGSIYISKSKIDHARTLAYYSGYMDLFAKSSTSENKLTEHAQAMRNKARELGLPQKEIISQISTGVTQAMNDYNAGRKSNLAKVLQQGLELLAYYSK